MPITERDYFEYPSDDVRENAAILLERVNKLLGMGGVPLPQGVTSGWRSSRHNATVPNASKTSRHLTGQAIDLADPTGELDDFLLAHQEYLEQCGLWLEHPSATKGWCHLQSVPPRSGNRVFYP